MPNFLHLRRGHNGRKLKKKHYPQMSPIARRILQKNGIGLSKERLRGIGIEPLQNRRYFISCINIYILYCI